MPGGIFPGGYGAGYQILQSSDFVVIYYEMIHEARIIPLDRPHLPGDIRQWNGDPRGRWEGDTLVIETINYNDKGTIGTNIATRAIRGLPQTEALHLVERLTPSGPDTIDYEVTIDDPWLVHPHLDRGHAAEPGPDLPDIRVRLPRRELRPGEQPQRGSRGGRGGRALAACDG